MDIQKSHREKVLSMVLQPNQECVVDSLETVKTSKLKRLISAYFDESEKIGNLFFLLKERVRQTRGLYAPLLELLSVLPDDVESLTEPQCFRASEIFIQFNSNCRENPFVCLEINELERMQKQNGFSKLRKHLNRRTNRSLCKANLIRRSTSVPGLLLIGTVTVTAVAAAAATAAAGHLVVAAVAAPCVAGCTAAPKKYAEKEEVRAKKLKDAADAALAVDADLRTIKRLVDSLRDAIETARGSIQIGLDRNGDMYPFNIKLLVRHLRHHGSDEFLQQLVQLEVYICRCFTFVNTARRRLQTICSA